MPATSAVREIHSFFFARQRPLQASSVHADAKAVGDCGDILRHGEIRRGRLQLVDVGENLGRDLVAILGSAPLWRRPTRPWSANALWAL